MRLYVHRLVKVTSPNASDASVRLVGIFSPYVTVSIDGRSGEGSGLEWASEMSSTPSAVDPIYSELIDLKLELPVNALDCPMLQIVLNEPSSAAFAGVGATKVAGAELDIVNLLPERLPGRSAPPSVTTPTEGGAPHSAPHGSPGSAATVAPIPRGAAALLATRSAVPPAKTRPASPTSCQARSSGMEAT